MDYERGRFTTVTANKPGLNRTVKIKFSGAVSKCYNRLLSMKT